jgi:hypothetical protein
MLADADFLGELFDLIAYAVCLSCHSDAERGGGKPFAGGLADMKTPFFAIFALPLRPSRLKAFAFKLAHDKSL